MTRMLLFILLGMQIAFFAQQVSVKETVEIKLMNDGENYFPKFNSDNSKLFYTKSNFQGLYSYDLASGINETISEDFGAGYEFTFTNDNHILYRINKYDASGLRRTQSLIDKDLISNEEIVLAIGKDISIPQNISDGQIAYSVNGKLENKNISSLAKSTNSISVPTVFVDDTKIVIWNNGMRKVLDPVQDGNYIWVSLSPDKTKLLFTSAGKGTFISDLNGNIQAELGYANAPKWSPDGKWILFMVDKDNGRQVISSDIFISTNDGKMKYQITNTEEIFEMYPEWSSNMSSVVYNSYDGKIFMTKLNIEE